LDIFVGNLSFDVVEADLRKLFEGFGSVASAVVVMSKEKKAPKSRGFAFVAMPNDEQALSAIAALNEKEFMGRLINVAPARAKPQPKIEIGPQEKTEPPVAAKARHYPRDDREEKKTWFSPVYKKPGTFSAGRRTRSFIKRRREAGLPEDVRPPRRKGQYNSLRWRKKSQQPKPWQKSDGGSKPWKKTEGEAKPWQKPAGEPRTWKKSKDKSKPWEKSVREAKSWRRHPERPKKSRFKGR